MSLEHHEFNDIWWNVPFSMLNLMWRYLINGNVMEPISFGNMYLLNNYHANILSETNTMLVYYYTFIYYFLCPMVDLYCNCIQATAILVLLPRLQIRVTMCFVLGNYPTLGCDIQGFRAMWLSVQYWPWWFQDFRRSDWLYHSEQMGPIWGSVPCQKKSFLCVK